MNLTLLSDPNALTLPHLAAGALCVSLVLAVPITALWRMLEWR